MRSWDSDGLACLKSDGGRAVRSPRFRHPCLGSASCLILISTDKKASHFSSHVQKWEAVHFAVGVFRPTSLTPLVNACYLDRAPDALKRCRSTDRDVGEVRVLGRLRHLGDSPQRALIQTSADAMRLAKQWPRGPMAVRRGFARYAGGPPGTWSPGGPLLVGVTCGFAYSQGSSAAALAPAKRPMVIALNTVAPMAAFHSQT